MSLTHWLSRVRKDQKRIIPKTGIYHFERNALQAKNRIHLRIEEDGNGLLMINAARAYHLNPTATTIAYWALSGDTDQEILHGLRKHFAIDSIQAQSDALPFLDQLSQITDPNEICPVCEMDMDMDLPFSHVPGSPYRMDLAITYRCNNDCLHCYNARPRSYRELDTPSWYRIIDQLWDLAIPHIVFTGGEPTLRKDLPQLITYAEKKGQITGINTNGRNLAKKEYLQTLVDAGLDHIQITLESVNPQIHDQMVNFKGAWNQTVEGIRNAASAGVYMMTNTTMLTTNVHTIADTLDFLAELGVPTVGLNALIYSGKGSQVGTGLRENQLAELLEMAKEKTTQHQQKMIWYTPTQYCRFNPLTHELGIKSCSAALYNMCIEPDGAVLPCQSYYQSLGNILEKPWKEIWQHPLAVSLRERRNLPEKCQGCELIVECGAGCPLAYEPEPAN